MKANINSINTVANSDIKKEISSKILTTNFQLILHTQIGQRLFNGEWTFGRMGLLQFAKLMTILWKAFKQDDPYAEWYLLKTHEAIQQAKDKLKHCELGLEQQLAQLRGFEFELMSSSMPLRQPLRFASPLAFMAAMLIEQVDYLNRQLLTLQRLGLAPDKNLMLADVLKEVQTVFHVPRAWKYTGITRKDIFEKNQKAEQVKQQFGDIPDAILKKETRFAFLSKHKIY